MGELPCIKDVPEGDYGEGNGNSHAPNGGFIYTCNGDHNSKGCDLRWKLATAGAIPTITGNAFGLCANKESGGF